MYMYKEMHQVSSLASTSTATTKSLENSLRAVALVKIGQSI